jgi:hypothetical protein
MNLTTHWVLAIALGIAVFHNIESALIISIGALMPDLDREYFFVAKDFIGKHQLHRSLFHNFLFIGGLYFLNPLLSLGALSHSLLDMLTSATDRGSEVLFPFTRIVKPFHYQIEGNELDHPKRAEWWVEDPWKLLQKTTDRDLQEPAEQPWRRSYGPFKNSRVVDWGIFFASFIFLGLMYATSPAYFSRSGFQFRSLISLGGIAIFYGLGEFWRRRPAKSKSRNSNYFVLIVLALGLLLFVLGSYYLFSFPSVPNLTLPAYAFVSLIVGFVASYFFVRLRKKYADLSM